MGLSIRVIRGEPFDASANPGPVLAIGNFDGLHRGHQAVLADAVEGAGKRGARAGILSFEPHPRTFFAPHNPVFQITSPELKARLAAALGIEFMAVLEFNRELAALSPQVFVEDFLVSQLGVSHVVTGSDFRFGKARAGDIAMLAELGTVHGFTVTAVDAIGDPEAEHPHFSSTSVRQALLHGNPRAAAEILGYWWTVLGEVVRGDQIGQTLGFPTINLAMEESSAPRLGSYAVRVRTCDGKSRDMWLGAGYVGRRPTFDKENVVLEVFLFDFSGDLYGRTVMIEFIEFIRGDEKFEDAETLRVNMQSDCDEARAILDALQREGDPVARFTLGAAQTSGAL